ncbi:hypothetical protein AOLI_G00179970 [Acnodon oligacanthus]
MVVFVVIFCTMFQPPVLVQMPCSMKEECEEIRLSDGGVGGVKAEESEISIDDADGIEVHVKDEPEEQTLSEETSQYAEFAIDLFAYDTGLCYKGVSGIF